MSKIEVDIKKDSIFKNIFLREEGRILMCNIISDLYNIDVSLLLSNLKYYNGEYPRLDYNIKSSYSDVVYEFDNKIFIIEMNRFYYEKSIYKNHFYLLFRHVFDANNKNSYNMNKETYLIDIDNYDINQMFGSGI
ncbi:MAG: PD-(D/E)XK nuclease family transposase [Bacilli bacterium]|nr:PD-(D/E)XK nuclease family transposase [Bacilli bacterium]